MKDSRLNEAEPRQRASSVIILPEHESIADEFAKLDSMRVDRIHTPSR